MLFNIENPCKKKNEKSKELKDSNTTKEEITPILIENDEMANKNKITVLYQAEEGKTFSFFNKNESNLKANDFFIREKSFSKMNLRNLNIIETNDIFYTPKESGNLTVEIYFNKNLTSLKEFFKNNKNLIKADFKNFNMEGVVSMESTFSGCSNLYEVDLEGVNSQNLLSINNTFEKCKKLEKVNLSMKNISEFLTSNNSFIDCENLKFINLSSFQNINNNMFLGIKSNPTIQANELIFNDLYYIFHIILKITINIIVTTNESNNECIRGNDDKCKDCSIIIKKNCATCNNGYYLPFNSINKEKCLSCNIIEHCSSCIGNENNALCFSCKEGFDLKNNKCEKKQNDIPLCHSGEHELCKKLQLR